MGCCFMPPVQAFQVSLSAATGGTTKAATPLLHPVRFSSNNDDSLSHDPVDDEYPDDSNGPDYNSSRRSRVRRLFSRLSTRLLPKQKTKPLRSLVATLAAVSSLRFGLLQQSQKAAHASAPVMALPKAEGRDPATEAMMVHEQKQLQAAQKELDDFAKQARHIESTQGAKARQQFEQEYQTKKVQESEAKAAGLMELKRTLLKQGICPWTDLEGQRQVILYNKGIDLATVSGTQFNLEALFQSKNSKRSMKIQKAPHRSIVQCMVQDMESRDVDALQYFETHQDQTASILELPVAEAQRILSQYETNLEQYGQITVPKPGELSVKERQEQLANDPKMRKQLERERRQKEKAAKKAERERIRAEQRAEKERLKAERQAEKEQKKAAAAAVGSAAVGAAGAAAQGVSSTIQGTASEALGSMVGPSDVGATTTTTMDQESTVTEDDTLVLDGEEFHDARMEEVPVASKKKASKLITAPKLVGATVVLGGGGYALKLYQDQAKIDEAERQRQLKLLMGELQGDDDDDDEEEDYDDDGMLEATTATVPPPAPVPTVPPPAVKRRKIGLKGVFGKKKNDRETDIMNLVGDSARAPEFATTLSKLLTFGAPGRFPGILALPGTMPMEEFQLEGANEILVFARESSDLTLEESAEVFANVVNCMLIDIVDLASASLREKDESVTVNAINIVVDFMNHAASLFKSVAGVVTIKPVTYGGDLSKSKLEQMYSTYATSGMMDFGNVKEDFEDRVALLRDVFSISEKKAEGLMMKAMQKQMMQMMKDPEKMEAMMEGMGGMEGMESLMGGMPGMPGQDGEMDPQQFKEMLVGLKAMKESGEIPEEEFNEVRKQFKESFGSSIEDVIAEATRKEGELEEVDKELLELMKSIMDD